MRIEIEPVTRVEGHGAIRVEVRDGVVRRAHWDVVETPRYFEAMLQGRSWQEAGILTARICGICSIGHCLTTVHATERAFGVTVPTLARDLRSLAKHGETLASHALHVLFLAAPDFLGLDSAIGLRTLRPELFALACRLKHLGNRLAETFAGRAVHPVSLLVGGVGRRPAPSEVEALLALIAGGHRDLDALVELVATFDLPDFQRETEYVSVASNGCYAWDGDEIVSSDGVRAPVGAYRSLTQERVLERSTAKVCRLSRDAYMVGALARVFNNGRHLSARAREAAGRLGLLDGMPNPFLNSAAQVVEMIHVVDVSEELLRRVLDAPDHVPLRGEVVPRAGRAVAAVEVPRGLLYHSLEYDASGRIVEADCVIPTTQNNANIEADLRALAARLSRQGLSDDQAALLCEMLVRAYDPCISCAVH